MSELREGAMNDGSVELGKQVLPVMASRRYHLGDEFPYEAFVQRAIEAHFHAAGFELDTTTDVDLSCMHPATGEARHIEAKGKTSGVGLDFRTYLGQLLQRMSRSETKYALALLDLSSYRGRTGKFMGTGRAAVALVLCHC